MIKNLT